ncbi:endonuclease/exonuclease/phosphatase family protein [Maridesulfovibrio sp.]|uniref:endonuclease/exonuclease/phosphatase family protein n=1 Tax=Maridesulfovibrio sp. TaxID=2795000 RepID=UPI002A18D121|nr:endonuclease/exonuclease/phosphatase family protein [Maridesulfovibrio sp.]
MMYTFLRYITPVFFLLILAVAAWFNFKWYKDPPFEISRIETGPINKYGGESRIQTEPEETFTIISYNMGFAAGPMQHTLADEHPESFFTANLEKLAAMIKVRKADVVLLQEIDLDSKRSWYMNQLDILMKTLGWGYAAPVVDWDMYFPLRKERKITKATVVISRFPLVSNEFCLTSAKPVFENNLLNIFYYPLLWKSCMQRVTVKAGIRELDIFNVHLCVWNRAARIAQANFLADWVRRTERNRNFIIGGDFNFQAYIRGTPVPTDDMLREPFLNIIWDSADGIKEILSSRTDSTDRLHEQFTFPERKHRYDFMFYSQKLKLERAGVIKDIDASDHLPVFGIFRFTP